MQGFGQAVELAAACCGSQALTLDPVGSSSGDATAWAPRRAIRRVLVGAADRVRHIIVGRRIDCARVPGPPDVQLALTFRGYRSGLPERGSRCGSHQNGWGRGGRAGGLEWCSWNRFARPGAQLMEHLALNLLGYGRRPKRVRFVISVRAIERTCDRRARQA